MSDILREAMSSIEGHAPGPEFEALLANFIEESKASGRGLAICLKYGAHSRGEVNATLDWWQAARNADLVSIGFSEQDAAMVSMACVNAMLREALLVCLNAHREEGSA